jgi:transmembrane sensor
VKPDPRLRAALEPAWSELREQRLLGRIVEARRQRARAVRRSALIAAGVATACAAAGLVIALRRPSPGSVAATAAAAPGTSRLTLVDGSEAVLASNGDVQIEEQSTGRVQLRQRAGSARYVVRHDPARDFVVSAEGVTVRVRGTIFSVNVRPDAVEIGVERGRVEIADRWRTRDLVAGEALSVPVHRPDDGAEPATAPPTLAPPAAAEAPASRPPARATATPAARASAAAPPAAAVLLERADAARATGRGDDAAHALEAFVAAYPRDRRLAAALFTLGRVERSRGRAEAAAAAFERCGRTRPAGPLADDALAEAAQAWHAAGAAANAGADARAYLRAHPGGIHAAAMRALAGSDASARR